MTVGVKLIHSDLTGSWLIAAFSLFSVFGLMLFLSPDAMAVMAAIKAKPECTMLETNDWNPSDAEKRYKSVLKAIDDGDEMAIHQELNNGLKLDVAIEIADVDPSMSPSRSAFVAPLDYAVIKGQQAIVSLFLEHGASPDGCATESYEPIFWALRHSQQDILEQLVEYGANVNTRIFYNTNAWPDQYLTPIFYLAIKNHCMAPKRGEVLRNMEFLINHGADLNAVSEGNPLLGWAMKSSIDSAPLLISYGVQLNGTLPDGGNILHWMSREIDDISAETRGDWNLLSSYVSAGGHRGIALAQNNPEIRSSLEKTRQHIITSQCLPFGSTSAYLVPQLVGLFASLPVIFVQELVGLFVGTSANVVQQLVGLLHQITEYSTASEKCIEPLPVNATFPLSGQCSIRDTIDVNLEDDAGNTPLYYAILNKRQIATTTLIDLGADANRAGESGLTPLHLAVLNQDQWQIDTLIKAGADPLIEDSSGRSAFDFAVSQPDSQFRETLGTVSSLCRDQTDVRFRILSTDYDCPGFLQAKSKMEESLAECVQDSPSIPKGLPASMHQLCIQLMPRERIKDVLVRESFQKHDWLPEILPTAISRMGMHDTYTLMHHATASSDAGQLKRLLDAVSMEEVSAGISYTWYNTANRLIWESSDPVVTSMLLEWGLDPDFNSFLKRGRYAADPRHITPLVRALQEGNLERANILIRYGASLSQPGLIPAAIHSGNLEALVYILEQGVTEEPLIIPHDCDEGAEILCENSYRLEKNGVSSDVALLLLLYRSSIFDPGVKKDPEQLAQQALDTRLIKAVMSLDAEETAASLAAGANPNTTFHCNAEDTAFHGVEDEDGRGCSAGLLADSLHLEQNLAEASVSRLLLLYGASVRHYFSTIMFPHQKRAQRSAGGESAIPSAWSSHILDHDLALALTLFDRAKAADIGAAEDKLTGIRTFLFPLLSLIPEKTQAPSLQLTSDVYQKILDMHQNTAISAGVAITHVSTPVYNCLNLKPAVAGADQAWLDGNSTPPFTPYLNGTMCFEGFCQAFTPESENPNYSGFPSPAQWKGVENFQPFCQKIHSRLSDDGKQALARIRKAAKI